MLSVIMSPHHEGMLIAMWVVMIAIGLEIVVALAMGLRGKANMREMAEVVTRPVLFDLFPLIILSILTMLDGTHILVLIWFYVAAVLIIIRVLLALSTHLRR
ncbi:hypothetical protein [Alicyclobacillus mengziensis]|uniref:Uncharacterized protein n=1 Tax=Alicyclobacillus mengziensis TaxID=2931921 RepID=A0A9X7VX95_9BACL|nr:hypothetical protein [Alicyclobacillus mengziensis]QSO46768.1 hypothetical protein JZ786_20380 [Alicyclobacillus mengziensis]